MTSNVVPNGMVHPLAELFPPLTDDELGELTADIKANGLIHPIVLDGDGTLLDGRNRLAACEKAGVAPEFEVWVGGDPAAYILSANVERRNLTKGQRAMAAVVLVNNSPSAKTRTTVRGLAGAIRADHAYVSRAATVSTYTPDAVADVLAGKVALQDAYLAAKQLKRDRSEADFSRTRPDFAGGPPVAEPVRAKTGTETEAVTGTAVGAPPPAAVATAATAPTKAPHPNGATAAPVRRRILRRGRTVKQAPSVDEVRRFVVQLATWLDHCAGQEAVENALAIIATDPPVDDFAGVCRAWGRALLAVADGAHERDRATATSAEATGGIG
jgi:hypothetical protein